MMKVVDLQTAEHQTNEEKNMNIVKQESCAIAKMTAQCALHMGALKIFGTH